MPKVVHFEIHVDDVDRAVNFYNTVFGWEFTKWEGPEDYWLIKAGDDDERGIDGGLIRRKAPQAGVYNTINVSSADRYVRLIEEHGGTIVVPKAAIPGVGWVAYFKDTEDNTFGVFEADEEAR
jgi:predicted enzyme related to lactoylglutathione lyase